MRSKLIVLAFTFVLGLSSLSIFAQTTNLPGKITVENGEPIPGATIRFKGKSGGVVSKEDGTFTIPSPGKGVLIISSIGFQEKEIDVNGLYNRPFDGWTELRRFDFPKLPLPVSAVSGFPNRYPYPATSNSEQTLNGKNYTDAAAAIGGDFVETKLFRDIY